MWMSQKFASVKKLAESWSDSRHADGEHLKLLKNMNHLPKYFFVAFGNEQGTEEKFMKI